MIVKCPSCEARFRIPEAKIKPTGTKVRCGKCRTMFRVAVSAGPEETPQGMESAPALGSGRAHVPTSGRSAQPGGGFPGMVGEGTLEVPALDIADIEAFEQQQSERVRVEALSNAAGLAAPRSVPRVSAPPPTIVPPPALPTTDAAPKAGRTKGRAAQAGAGVLRSAAAATTRPAAASAHVSQPTPRRDAAPNPERVETPSDQLPAIPARSAASTLPPESATPPPDESWSAEFAAQSFAERSAASGPGQTHAPATSSHTDHDHDTHGRTDSREHRSPSASLEATTPSAGAHRAARWMAVALAVTLTLVVFFGFVALRNGGTLDFTDMGRMFGVAFAGERHPEPTLRVLRVYDVNGEPVEEPVVSLEVPLRIEDVEQTVYMTQDRVPLVVVQGSLRNTGQDPHRRIMVAGRVYAGSELVASVQGPVGATATPEDLEGLHTAEDVGALHRTLERSAADFVIRGNEGSLFTLVFPANEALTEAPEQMSYEVELVSAEWLDATNGWQRLEYDLEETGDTQPQ
jgi:predicted Zn finger-like uncharacterized protein